MLSRTRRLWLPVVLAVFLLVTLLFGQVEGISDPAVSDKPMSILNNWNFERSIRNDQFNAPYDWWFWEAARWGVSAGKVEGFSIKDNVISIRIANPGVDTWHIQFNQWVKLVPRQSYYISFRARADVPKAINVKILQTREPWTNYFAKTVELNKDWQRFEFFYTHGERSDEVVTFGFELGKTVATTVYISEVVLRPVDKSELPAEEDEEETIEYVFDEDEPDELVNNGDFAYKIINDQGSMPFEWWIWQAGQYGIAPARVSEYGTRDGFGYLAVESTGTETWHIQFNQWIKIRKGGRYVLSFSARADAPRTINVKFVQTGAPYTNYFAQTLTLTRNWQTFTFEYEHPKDADPVVTLSFELGSGVPTVFYFRNVSLSPKK